MTRVSGIFPSSVCAVALLPELVLHTFGHNHTRICHVSTCARLRRLATTSVLLTLFQLNIPEDYNQLITQISCRPNFSSNASENSYPEIYMSGSPRELRQLPRQVGQPTTGKTRKFQQEICKCSAKQKTKNTLTDHLLTNHQLDKPSCHTENCLSKV